MIAWNEISIAELVPSIEKSVHNAHFEFDPNGNLKNLTDAYIPLCFSGFESVGIKTKDFEHKFCQSFKTVIYRGKQCYKIDMKNSKDFRSSYLTILTDNRYYDLSTYSTFPNIIRENIIWFKGQVTEVNPDTSIGTVYMDTTEGLEIEDGKTLKEKINILTDNVGKYNDNKLKTLFLNVKSPMMYKTTPGFDQLSKSMRPCAIRAELPKDYNRKSCIYDYILEARESRCNCSKWFRLKAASRVCSIEDLACLGEPQHKLEELQKMDPDLYAKALDACLLPCERLYITLQASDQHPGNIYPVSEASLYKIARDYSEFKLR